MLRDLAAKSVTKPVVLKRGIWGQEVFGKGIWGQILQSSRFLFSLPCHMCFSLTFFAYIAAFHRLVTGRLESRRVSRDPTGIHCQPCSTDDEVVNLSEKQKYLAREKGNRFKDMRELQSLGNNGNPSMGESEWVIPL